MPSVRDTRTFTGDGDSKRDIQSCVCRRQTRSCSSDILTARVTRSRVEDTGIGGERKRVARMFNVTLSNNARSGLGQPSTDPPSRAGQTHTEGRAEPSAGRTDTFRYVKSSPVKVFV